MVHRDQHMELTVKGSDHATHAQASRPLIQFGFDLSMLLSTDGGWWGIERRVPLRSFVESDFHRTVDDCTPDRYRL